MRRSSAAGTSLAFGLVAGLVFAAVVWRLTPVSSPPLSSASTSAAPPSQPPIYTAGSVPMASSPGGATIAVLAPATPLTSTGERDGWIHVEADLYRAPDSPMVLYQDPARLMRTGVLTTPNGASETSTLTIAGSPWQRVRLAGWVPVTSTSDDLADLWLRASISYNRACGHCHSVHAPSEHTASQWVSQFRRMVPRTSLTPTQADLVLNWLQAHAPQ